MRQGVGSNLRAEATMALRGGAAAALCRVAVPANETIRRTALQDGTARDSDGERRRPGGRTSLEVQ